MNEYRIRVEQRPDESFTRFYPEVNSWIGKTVHSKWRNTQIPIEIRWYKTEEECVKLLDSLYAFDKERNGDYTTEIIKYPKEKNIK